MGLEFFSYIAQIVAFLAIIVSTVYGVIFGYHWHTYGSSKKISSTAMVTYMIGAALLIAIMLVTANNF